jgi:hypothetical protein
MVLAIIHVTVLLNSFAIPDGGTHEPIIPPERFFRVAQSGVELSVRQVLQKKILRVPVDPTKFVILKPIKDSQPNYLFLPQSSSKSSTPDDAASKEVCFLLRANGSHKTGS